MGYFFRRSANIGPLRLNFSKSGVGASVGVRGARLTVTPRGTTYITVGRNGFYYRETISNRRGNSNLRVPSQVSPITSPPGEIPTADASDLVDSSSEALVARLNERAQMFNPAWLIYSAAVLLFLIGITTLPGDAPSRPALPMYGVNAYAALVARYGYPNSVLANIPLGMVPVRTAVYSTAGVGGVFVPNTCKTVYEEVMRVLHDEVRYPGLAKQARKRIRPCIARSDAAWDAVSYVATESKVEISADNAKGLLADIRTKETSPPLIQSEQPTGTRQTTTSKRGASNQGAVKQVWSAPEEVLRQFQDDEQSGTSTWNVQGYSSYAFMVTSVVCVGLAMIVHRKNSAKRISRLFYELSESEEQKYSTVQQAVAHLSKSHQTWRIKGDAPTSDWKRNAGASSLVRRVSSTVGFSNPPRVESNVKTPSLNIGGVSLYFMPDLVLYWEHGAFGAVAYEDFAVEQGSTRFIEDGYVPADGAVVGKTWRYVNKNGGPDRRFNNNAQLPILQYGTLAFRSSRGLNVHLQTSSLGASESFANCWHQLRGRIGTVQIRPTADDGQHDFPPNPEAQARKVLGVSGTASQDEIGAAYRRLAQMYHPDKVAGLALEFQVIADTRMKELNAAHELLKQRRNS